MKRVIFIFLIVCTFIPVGVIVCNAEIAQLRAYVSILPQSYFVEYIGGDMVSVEVLIKPGKDPHTFEPTPKQMIALSNGQLYFGIGFPFEHRILEKVQSANPRFKLIHTDRGIKKRPLDVPHPHEHKVHERYAENHQYKQGVLDPHIWLSEPEIKIQVKNIYDALVKIDPAHRDIYKSNLDQFIKELDEVHKTILELFEPYRGRTFFVFHPAFGYFADLYGLIQVPIEIEGKSPTPKQIESLIEEAVEYNVKMIFVSPQFDRKSAEVIAQAIGGAVVLIDPLEKNVLANLEDIAMKIQRSLK